MGIQPDSILGVAVSTVTEKMAYLEALSDRYNTLLSAALSGLGQVQVTDIPAPQRLPVPAVAAPAVTLDAQPVFTPPALTIPPMPSGIEIESLLGNLDVGNLDDLPSAPEPLPINIPDAPGLRAIEKPVRPDVDVAVDLPQAPNLVMPDMEELAQISLPEFVMPELPAFDAVAPDTRDISVPSVFINWAEPSYSSELLDELQAKVREWMAGGTGLPAAVEDALFARARERDSVETERQVQESIDTWAARGFGMPPGMLAKEAAVIREQGRLKAAELNRDILVQATQLEIENIRFAVQQGIALEQLTENLFENMVKRLFEAARFQAEAQINVFNAQVSLFNAQNAAFQTLSQVYRTRLDGALAKLTAFKAAVDAQAAVGQINQQRVEVFKAKLSGVQASVEVFSSLMRAAQVRADVIKNQFDAYRADVQAYAEEISAEKLKFDAYEAQVKAESAKAGAFDSQARAYASTVQALASKADLKAKGAQLRMEAAKTRVSKFLADVDGFKAALQASLGDVQYRTQAFAAQVDGWRAKANVAVSDAEMKTRFADMQTRTNIAHSEMQITEYNARMQHAIQQAQLALESAKALGQYTAQLAAGAMSAMHVSAGISGSGSASSSDSRSTSTSTSYTYSY